LLVLVVLRIQYGKTGTETQAASTGMTEKEAVVL
jgi:hypothetical protein